VHLSVALAISVGLRLLPGGLHSNCADSDTGLRYRYGTPSKLSDTDSVPVPRYRGGPHSKLCGSGTGNVSGLRPLPGGLPSKYDDSDTGFRYRYGTPPKLSDTDSVPVPRYQGGPPSKLGGSGTGNVSGTDKLPVPY